MNIIRSRGFDIKVDHHIPVVVGIADIAAYRAAGGGGLHTGEDPIFYIDHKIVGPGLDPAGFAGGGGIAQEYPVIVNRNRGTGGRLQIQNPVIKIYEVAAGAAVIGIPQFQTGRGGGRQKDSAFQRLQG
ncbi:MAG: hypothetical protein BWY71_01624 [Planctomycetes bacterium ADurb.Bin412]|nr:MAG: hypothetical protein BWY71_01624 [Planctomycetes bacterium ADurb.Bin412]